MVKSIIVYCELLGSKFSESSYELISKARELSDSYQANYKIRAVALGLLIDEETKKLAYSAGANEITLIKDNKFFEFNNVSYAKAFVEYFNQNKSDIILFSATTRGRILAPRITTTLQTGLVADCTALDFIKKDDEFKLAATRPTFGSQLMATILSRKTPECATIRPKTFKAEFKYGDEGVYSEYQLNTTPKFLSELGIEIKSIQKEIGSTIDIAHAKMIFCAGFGLYDGAKNSYIEKLELLADKYSAQFAATRKLVDYGTVSHSYQIGQTGATVEPELYIGFGVSGAMQHIQGMKNSKKIIAINLDESAPIFDYCDYKIVEDAKKVIDELV